jgi:sodium/hydrogen antiporter
VISLLAGITFSPHATNLIRPLDYALGSENNLSYITLYFSRLVLGVQLVLAGVQLPSRYLKREWKSLTYLLGPNMVIMWICASLLIFAMVPGLPILHALACGACVTPTDPVLSNSIVKGKFADKNIPKDLQKIIIAESGANDGLGYPFLFLALYLIKYNGDGGLGQTGHSAKAMGYWFGEIWGYTIILSVIYGITVGWIAKELLHFAEERKFVDRESFLVFAITLALFITGTCGMIGSDDVLACFVAGNVFTWDDWFRLETLDDSLQPTIDMLLNLSIFIWYGAVCPWASFRHNDVMPIYRLIFLGILILLFRRIPSILLLHKQIWQIEHLQQALFVGFFGPIGVSAIFYLYVSIDFLDQVTVNGEVREDAKRLKDVMTVVIWFLAICSIVVHGLSIPIGKLGYQIPRTISSALSTSFENTEPQNVRLREDPHSASAPGRPGLRQRRNGQEPPPQGVFKLGGSTIRSENNSRVQSPASPEPSRPINFVSATNSAHDTPKDSPKLSAQVSADGARVVEEGLSPG